MKWETLEGTSVCFSFHIACLVYKSPQADVGISLRGGKVFTFYVSLLLPVAGPLHIRPCGATFSKQEKAWGCSYWAAGKSTGFSIHLGPVHLPRGGRRPPGGGYLAPANSDSSCFFPQKTLYWTQPQRKGRKDHEHGFQTQADHPL